MDAEEKLKQLCIKLPPTPSPLGSYIPFIKIGKLVFLSGVLPLIDGKLLRQGKVGENVSLDEAREDARIATINAISILKSNLGSLNKIKRCVKITGYIASSNDFTKQPEVLNTASDLLLEIFGDSGRHVRSAVGVNVLPFNSPLEIEFIFEVV